MPPPPPIGPIEDIFWWLIWLGVIAVIVLGSIYLLSEVFGVLPKPRKQQAADDSTELMRQLLEEIRSLREEIRRLRKELEAE